VVASLCIMAFLVFIIIYGIYWLHRRQMLPWSVKNKLETKDPGFSAVTQKHTYEIFDSMLRELAGGFGSKPKNDFDKDLAELNPFMKKGALKPYRRLSLVIF
jgi:hypothetical protein